MRKSKKLRVDNQAVSKAQNKLDAILDIKGTGLPCNHKYQRVEQIGKTHYQICCNKKCGRKLFVR